MEIHNFIAARMEMLASLQYTPDTTPRQIQNIADVTGITFLQGFQLQVRRLLQQGNDYTKCFITWFAQI